MKVFRSLLTLFLSATSFGQQGLFGSAATDRPTRTYDVHHYKLELRFNEAQKNVIGTTTITFSPLDTRLDSIMLHAVDMHVHRIALGTGRDLRYANNRKELTVYLDRSYGFADTVRLAIDYSCTPKEGLYFIAPDSIDPTNRHQIWTQGEDMDNRHWFPCWDYPNDKATSEVIATVRDSWSVLSNGKLLNVTWDAKHKTKTFHWLQAKPHVSYLIMIAAGEYSILTDRYKNIPIEYYVYSDRAEDARRSLAATPRIMKFFDETISFPYPWEKYSQIFIDDFMWGGMENTSAVTLNTSYLIDDRGRLDFSADDVVAHEFAHQYFGDLVSFRDWSHLWLSEGFANYYEALYKRHAKGFDEFQKDLMDQAESIIRVERAQGRKPIVSNESFTTNLYSKGAWVLYMLHSLLGDVEFQRAINLYVQRHAFTSVSTFDFMKAVEDATGENLDWFFLQWVFRAGHPKLEVTQSWNDKANTLTLTIRQVQTLDSLTGPFVLPFDIEVTTAQGKTLKSIRLTKQEETISIPLASKPLMVLVDKGMKILKSLTFEKSKEEYILQALQATDAADRISAVKALKDVPTDVEVFRTLKKTALHDAFWAVRREAALAVGEMNVDGVKQALFEIYNDKHSSVRNAAIVGMENLKGNDVANFLRNALTRDSSYVVQSSCLQSLAKVDSASAVALAHVYVEKNSHRDILRRGALNVLRMVHSSESLPYAKKYAALGNAPDIRAMALGVLRDVGEKDSSVRSFVIRLANDANVAIRKGAIRTLAQWGGDDSRTALEERKSRESDDEVKRAIDSALEELMK
jgi:aminopeptidase N